MPEDWGYTLIDRKRRRKPEHKDKLSKDMSTLATRPHSKWSFLYKAITTNAFLRHSYTKKLYAICWEESKSVKRKKHFIDALQETGSSIFYSYFQPICVVVILIYDRTISFEKTLYIKDYCMILDKLNTKLLQWVLLLIGVKVLTFPSDWMLWRRCRVGTTPWEQECRDFGEWKGERRSSVVGGAELSGVETVADAVCSPWVDKMKGWRYDWKGYARLMRGEGGRWMGTDIKFTIWIAVILSP